MERITFQLEDNEFVDFFVLEQTRVNGVNYILVTEEEEGDGDALILKDTAQPEEEESVYEIVSDDIELSAIATIFESILEDVSFIEEDNGRKHKSKKENKKQK